MRGADHSDHVDDLCLGCAQGDEAAFREAYRRFGGALYATAWRILRSPQDAEEVVQETFLTLYRKADQARPLNLGAWLHRVAVNGSLDRLRSRKRRSEVELREKARGAALPRGIDIDRAIARLPERARMVFVLHDVEGFKHREIGELMGITDGASKSQLFRARGMLRDWLGEQ